ncbi:MAG: hypothetical protein LBL41_04050 [Bifidobacteriaceae bacterium]|jgi:hypothetical protein|nr:hypothetical protein [Bifidobacteriaceae bacterium]
MQIVNEALGRWELELNLDGARAENGGDKLSLSIPYIDSEATARLMAGKTVPLTALISDSDSLADAKATLRKSKLLSTIELGIGFYTSSNQDAKSPLLTVPIAIKNVGMEFEVSTLGKTKISANLLNTLKRLDVRLDKIDALSRLSKEELALSEIITIVSDEAKKYIAGFQFLPKCEIGNWTNKKQKNISDLLKMRSTIRMNRQLLAMLGDEKALQSLNEINQKLPKYDGRDKDPKTEVGVADLYPKARFLLDLLAYDCSCTVSSRNRQSASEFASALIAQSALLGIRTLYLTDDKNALTNTYQQLQKNGIQNAALCIDDLSDYKEKIVLELSDQLRIDEKVQANIEIEVELAKVAKKMEQYLHALHAKDNPFNTSLYDILQNITTVSESNRILDKHVLFDYDTTMRLTKNLVETSNTLVQLKTLEQQNPSSLSGASNWKDAEIVSENTAKDAIMRVDSLVSNDYINELKSDAEQMARETNTAVPRTFNEHNALITLLESIRECLDTFKPEIFMIISDEMVNASLSKDERNKNGFRMSSFRANALVKEAKSYQRPGIDIQNLHDVLEFLLKVANSWKKVSHERLVSLPSKLAEYKDRMLLAGDDISKLGALIPAKQLKDMEFGELNGYLSGLKNDEHKLLAITEINEYLFKLRKLGLQQFIDNLEEHSDPELALSEFTFSYFCSLYNAIYAKYKHMFQNDDGAYYDSLFESFMALDKEHLQNLRYAYQVNIKSKARDIRIQNKQKILELIKKYTKKNEDFASTNSNNSDSSMLPAELSDTLSTLFSCLMLTIDSVPKVLKAKETHDLVIIDLVSNPKMHDLVSLIARGKNVILLADTNEITDDELGKFARTLPEYSLDFAPISGDFIFAKFISSFSTLPIIPKVKKMAINSTFIDETGAFDTADNQVKWSFAEVNAVAEEAVAKSDAETSVIALTKDSLERIRSEVATKKPSNEADFAVFTDSKLLKDVILSISYSRASSGKLTNNFGYLDTDAGYVDFMHFLERLSVADSLRIYTTLESAHFAGATLSPGAKLLRDFLFFLETTASESLPDIEHKMFTLTETKSVQISEIREKLNINSSTAESNLLDDLEVSLINRGYNAYLNYSVGDSYSIPLVAKNPKNHKAVAIITDDHDYIAVKSLRLKNRLRMQELESAGYKVLTLWSVALFVNPGECLEKVIAELQ